MLQSEEQWREQWKDMINHTKATLIKKWFVMEPDDVSSIVDLQITKAYKRGLATNKETFVLTPKTIISFTNRAIAKEIRKWPGVQRIFVEEKGKKKKQYIYHGCVSLDTPFDDNEDSTMIDFLPSNEPSAQELVEKDESIQEMKKILLKYITPRTFDQLVFEMQNHCITASNANLIAKLKARIKNEQN